MKMFFGAGGSLERLLKIHEDNRGNELRSWKEVSLVGILIGLILAGTAGYFEAGGMLAISAVATGASFGLATYAKHELDQL